MNNSQIQDRLEYFDGAKRRISNQLSMLPTFIVEQRDALVVAGQLDSIHKEVETLAGLLKIKTSHAKAVNQYEALNAVAEALREIDEEILPMELKLPITVQIREVAQKALANLDAVRKGAQ
jgi:hypothetical protein